MPEFTLPLPIDPVYSDYGTRKKRQLLDALYNQCYNRFTALLRDSAFGVSTGETEVLRARVTYFIDNYLQYIMDRATFAVRLEVDKKTSSYHLELAALVREFKKLLEYMDDLYSGVMNTEGDTSYTVIRYFMLENNFCV
jgi:AcrR family transcriptional regulator